MALVSENESGDTRRSWRREQPAGLRRASCIAPVSCVALPDGRL